MTAEERLEQYRERRQEGRVSRSMSDAEWRAFVDAMDEWCTLTTIGRDGYPHSIAIGYFRLGDDLYMGMRDGTQKVKNAERNPHATAMIARARNRGGVVGVMVQGAAQIVREADERLTLARESARVRGLPEAEWPTEVTPTGVYFKLHAEKVISWTYDD